MRRTLASTIISVLALTAALGWLAPSATQAAPTAAFGSNTITGTLVATPSSTLPATLLIQSGDRTISVVVTADTQVEDSAGNALSLASLADGDNLLVTTTTNRQGSRGRGQSTAVDASVIQDLSQPVSPAQPISPTQLMVTGTLAGEFTGGLCLQNANVTNSGISPSAIMANPCPSGDLPVYLASGAAIENAAGTAITLASLLLNDSLQATGTVTNGQFTATTVQDLTQSAAPVPTTYQLVVTGTLAGEFTNGLCLQNTSVTNGAISPAAVTASPCPSGDLPVYLASGATIENNAGTAIAESSLLLNDSLQATGTVSNSQFSASLVQDLTQSTAPVPTTYQLVVTGALAGEFTNGLCLQNTSVTNGAISPAAMTVSPCPSGDLPVYLASGATIENAGGTAITYASLQLNDSLQATGTVSNGQFSAASVQDLTQTVVNNSSNPPPNNNSNQNTLTTLVGTIQTCHFSGRNPYFTIKVNQGSLRGMFTIYVQNGTQILGKRSRRTKTSSLHAGDVVTVQGMYNRHNHRWSSTTRVNVHA